MKNLKPGLGCCHSALWSMLTEAAREASEAVENSLYEISNWSIFSTEGGLSRPRVPVRSRTYLRYLGLEVWLFTLCDVGTKYRRENVCSLDIWIGSHFFLKPSIYLDYKIKSHFLHFYGIWEINYKWFSDEFLRIYWRHRCYSKMIFSKGQSIFFRKRPVIIFQILR